MKKNANNGSIWLLECVMAVALFILLAGVSALFREAVCALLDGLSLDSSVARRVLSRQGQLVMVIAGIIIMRRNAWHWYIVIRHFTKTSDLQYFHKKLIPLSQQKINPLIRSTALSNLLGLDSYQGNSEKVKALSLFMLRKEKGLVGIADAYTALIQELILEADFKAAQRYWEEAIRFSGVMDKKESIACQRLKLYGYVLKEQYEEGIVLLEQIPKALQTWRENAEECIFWDWYLHHHARKAEAVIYRQKLEKIPSMHQGYHKVLERNPA